MLLMLSAMQQPAAAEPISLTFALFASSLGSLTVGGLSLAQLGAFALTAGLSLASSFLGRKKTTNPGDYKSTFQTEESSEVNAIGRVRLGGLVAFGNTRLTDRYRLIWHAKGPLSAIELYYLGGREVCVEDDTIVSTPPYYRQVENQAAITVETKTGTGTETAYSALTSAFPQLWTANHRGRGIAQSLVKYRSPGIYTEDFGLLYSSGEPALEIVARMNSAYDPRDVAQDVNDQATWKWTDNGILCAARIMMAYPDLSVESLDWDFIADEADRADALVSTKTSTEARSRCSGIWLSEAKRGDTMQEVLDSIGAEIVTTEEGLIRIRLIDDNPLAEISLTAQHQLSFAWKSGPEAVERPNVCIVKYYSPEANYEMAEIDMTGIAWARIDDEIARYGEKLFTVELPFCPSPSQAQRIARRLFRLARADTGQVTMNTTGLAAWGLTYALVEDLDDETSMLSRIAPPRINDAEGTVDIPFVVWPLLPVWNPVSDEASAPTQIPDVQFEAGLDKPSAPSAASVVQYADLSYETRLKATLVTGAAASQNAINAVFRSWTGGLPNPFRRMIAYLGPGTTFYAYKAANSVGARADFKVQLFNATNDPTYYSDILRKEPMAIDNSAPAAPTLSANAVFNGSLNRWEFSPVARTTAMNVAKLDILKESAPGSGTYNVIATSNGRPDIDLTTAFNVPKPGAGSETIRLRAIAYTSNNTPSATTQVNTVIT